MRIQITAKHADLPDDVRIFANEKLEKLEKFDSNITQAQLIIANEFVTPSPTDEGLGSDNEPGERHAKGTDLTGNLASAEVVLSVPGTTPLVAHGRGESFRSAIDAVIGKAERQLRKHKERLKDKHRRS